MKYFVGGIIGFIIGLFLFMLIDYIDPINKPVESIGGQISLTDSTS